MTAKIKSKNPYGSSTHHGKPRGVSPGSFEKVYWPFLPIAIGIVLMLPFGLKSSAIKQPIGRVLSYQTSENPEVLLADTNAQREKSHESSLVLNEQLTIAAQNKAEDMASRNYWSHNTPDGTAPWSFVTNAGYQYQNLGENLAAGFGSDDDILNAWMASASHKANILNTAYSQVGFGYANNPNYTSAGGGPMTIVVAFYGSPYQPFKYAIAHPSSATPKTETASTDTRITPKVQLATGSSTVNTWVPLIVSLGALAVAAIWVGHHLVQIKTAAGKSKRYAYRHPLMDIGFIIFIGLAYVLLQTGGYIK